MGLGTAHAAAWFRAHAQPEPEKQQQQQHQQPQRQQHVQQHEQQQLEQLQQQEAPLKFVYEPELLVNPQLIDELNLRQQLAQEDPYGYDEEAPTAAKRAQTFVRFGKRAQTFVRFGKRAQTFVRFG